MIVHEYGLVWHYGRQARKPKKWQSVHCRETNMLTQMQRITWAWWLVLRLLTLPGRGSLPQSWLQLCFTQKQRHKGAMPWPIHTVLEVKCRHKHPASITGPDRISSLLISLHSTQWAYPADHILAEMPEQSAECLSWVDRVEGDQTYQTPLAGILPSSSLLSIFQSIKSQFHFKI